ncbi:hypothetical protein D3C80_1295470 [compost metagenome]
MLKPIQPTTSRGTRQTYFNVDVEQEGSVRTEVSQNELLELCNTIVPDVPTTALISVSGIGEPVADHDSATFDARPDNLINVLSS